MIRCLGARFTLVTLACVALAGCESATDMGADLPADAEVTVALDGSHATRVFRFVPADSGWYLAFIHVISGFAALAVTDSATGAEVARVSHGPDTATIGDGTGAGFRAVAGAVYNVAVSAIPEGSAVSARVLLDRIEEDPESHARALALGDTVKTETIDTWSDVDVYELTGTPDSEVVIAAQALGDSSNATLRFRATSDDAPLVARSVRAGGNALAGSRVSFGASGRILVRVESDPALRFSGAYRLWTYRVNRGPEAGPGVAPFYQEINETINHAGDVDEFTFTVAAGAEVNVTLRQWRLFRLDLVAPDGAVIAAILPNVLLDTNATRQTGNQPLPGAGVYRVRVYGVSSDDLADVGRYRIRVNLLNRAPEAAPVALGTDTVADAIDSNGDIDEFTIAPTAEYDRLRMWLSVSGLTGGSFVGIEAVPVNPDGSSGSATLGIGSSPASLAGVFNPPAGTQRIRVQPLGSIYEYTTGPYRLHVARVAGVPETAAATVAPGDSVVNESIDVAGDRDVYQLIVTSPVNLGVQLQTPGVLSNAMAVTLTGLTTFVYSTVSSPGVLTLPTTTLVPGTYRVIVDGSVTQSSFLQTGAYRLRLNIVP